MTLCSTSHEKEFHLGTFPGDFQLGVTPPAHSTEGTLDEGRSPVYSMIFPFIIVFLWFVRQVDNERYFNQYCIIGCVDHSV